jgi:predicted O-methyltransferase YrrM
MTGHFFLIKEYIHYLLHAKTAHGVHSPFVFDFIQTVLKDDRHFYAFDQIAAFRKKVLSDKQLLNVEDFGAGSLKGSFMQRVVSDIARNAGRNDKFGRLLFRIVNKYGCNKIIELGTSMGLGTSYLALANSHGEVVTLEGSQEIAAKAGEHFRELKLNHVKQVVGNFDETYERVLREHQPIDLIFIDGNHRKEPTIDYFKKSLSAIHNDSILIFDDIHWSQGMREAWDEIARDEHVRLSLDLFYFGIVFFKAEFKEKQHFVLRF